MDLAFTIEHMMMEIDASKKSKSSRIWGTTWNFKVEDGQQHIEFREPDQFLSFVFDLGLRNKSLILMSWNMYDLYYDPNVQMPGYYEIVLNVVVVDRPCPEQIVALGNIVQKMIDD